MISVILQESWLSVASHKLRSFLTTLGIIIGVCAVVMMVAAGQTVSNIINDSFSSLGGNLMIIIPGASNSGGIRTQQGRSSLTRHDIEAIAELKDVMAVAPIVGSAAQAVNGSNNWNVSITGTTPDYLLVGNWEIDKGAMFGDRDVKSAAPYVVVGQTVIAELFNGQNPVGQILRIKNIPFRVIGTLKPKGQDLGGRDQDNIVVMPFTTTRQRIAGNFMPDRVDVGIIKIEDNRDMDVVQRRIQNLLRARHGLKEGHENDFDVRNLTEIVNTVKTAGTVLSLLLTTIASISLIVGSIGIMNMMLVSVTERTREIGIRKAMGAPHRWILFQFLAESILISFIGSVVGLIIGLGLSQAGGYIFDKTVPISMWTIVLSFTVAVVVGIVSGSLPAYRAMKLDPIEALRYQ